MSGEKILTWVIGVSVGAIVASLAIMIVISAIHAVIYGAPA